MKIIDHYLCMDNGQPYPFEKSPNCGREMQSGQPKYLIMHFTAGRSYQSSIDWLCNPEADASAHLVIGRNGGITQLVPFNVIAWHAGKSKWKGLDGMNKYSIGIEMDNMGELTLKDDGYHPWFQTSPVPEDQVLKDTPHQFGPAKKRNWHRYTKEQLDAAFEVALLLVQTYQLKEILGHEEIAPKRKTDPGPDFPMDKLRALAYSDSVPVIETYQVTVENLNIRQGPNKEYDSVGDPLPKGARVQVLEVSDENPRWKKVDVLDDDRVGWVNSAPVNSPPTLEKVVS